MGFEKLRELLYDIKLDDKEYSLELHLEYMKGSVVEKDYIKTHLMSGFKSASTAKQELNVLKSILKVVTVHPDEWFFGVIHLPGFKQITVSQDAYTLDLADMVLSSEEWRALGQELDLSPHEQSLFDQHHYLWIAKKDLDAITTVLRRYYHQARDSASAMNVPIHALKRPNIALHSNGSLVMDLNSGYGKSFYLRKKGTWVRSNGLYGTTTPYDNGEELDIMLLKWKPPGIRTSSLIQRVAASKGD